MKKAINKLLILLCLSSKLKENKEIIEPRLSNFSEECPYPSNERLIMYNTVTNKNIGYVKKLER